MRRLGVLRVLGVALVGCGLDKVVPIPDYPSVIDGAAFPKALMQPPTGRALGLSPTLQGKVTQWSAAKILPVSLEWPQVNIIGGIEKTGDFKVELPDQPVAEPVNGFAAVTTLKQLVWGLNIFENHNCSVDTLNISAPDVQAIRLSLVIPNPYLTQVTLKPQTSLPLAYSGFNLFNTYFNAIETVSYSSADASAKSELSCTSPYLEGPRYHLFVNMTFTKGWNAATLLYATERTVSSEHIHDMLLQGGVLSTTAVF